MQTPENTNRRWTREEIEFIKSNYRGVSVSDLAKQLGRSSKATRGKIERLGIRLSVLKRNEPKPKVIRRKYKGWHLDSYGRKQISIGGRTVAEHRHLVSKNIGRKLKRTEQVHHINCDKTDNRIENLHLFNNASDHFKCHRSIEKLVKGLLEQGIIKFNSSKGIYEKICKNQ